jgi:Family of unknown function (DUF695)
MIPTPHYTLINTSRGDDPAVVTVNSALRAFKDRDAFSWHLKLSVTCELVGANGMPTSREIELLNRLEEEIAAALQVQKNVLFLARITCKGTRDLLYRAHDPKIVNEALQQLISAHSQSREWEYRLEQDIDWKLAEPELRLLESDPRFN